MTEKAKEIKKKCMAMFQEGDKITCAWRPADISIVCCPTKWRISRSNSVYFFDKDTTDRIYLYSKKHERWATILNKANYQYSVFF